jgi:uncharacterized protein YbcI
MTLAVECAPEVEDGRRIHVEIFESHDGVRCDCADQVMVLHVGDAVALSETVTCRDEKGRALAKQNFTLNIKITEVVDP